MWIKDGNPGTADMTAPNNQNNGKEMTEHKVVPAEDLERTAIKGKVNNHLYQTSVLHTQNHSQKG